MPAKTEKPAKVAAKGKPAKSKKGSKKTGASRISVILDGVPATEMTKEQLLVHVTRLVDSLEGERQERNLLQLERDQIYNFWQVAKDHIEDFKAQLKVKQKEVEDNEELRQADIAIYKQRIKYLLYEHQCTLSDAQAEHHAGIELANQQKESALEVLRREHEKTKEQLRTAEAQFKLDLQQLREHHADELSILRSRFEAEMKQLETRQRRTLDNISNDRDNRRKTEVQETEASFKQHIKNLKDNHEKSIISMKNYYNDIILNNMTLITALKEQVAELRAKEERLEKQLHASVKEARRLRDTCEKYESESKVMKKDNEQWTRARQSLQHAKSHEKALSQQLEQKDWEQEVTEQALERIKKERDQLEQKFVAAILEIQQKANFKQLILEKKLKSLEMALEQKEEQLTQLSSSASKMINDSTVSGEHTGHQKNTAIVKLPASNSITKSNRSRDASATNLSRVSTSIEERLSYSAHDVSRSVEEVTRSSIQSIKFVSAKPAKGRGKQTVRNVSSAK